MAQRLSEIGDLYVQYGCGWTAPRTWMNFDASPTLRFERIPMLGSLYSKNARRFPENVRYGDIVAGLPIPDSSCAAIYCSHVLEHLALDHAKVALRQTLRYLKPGGTFRLVVPDMRILAANYLSDTAPDAAHRFMEASGLGRAQSRVGILGLLTKLFGNSQHLWMWDEPSLMEALRSAGFGSIRACSFGDARDPAFMDVEDPSRFESAVSIEAQRSS